jgi:ABC-type dipeptide/oligopeptide/nickel transport system permease component
MTRFLLRRLESILFISLAIVLFCAVGLRLMRQTPGHTAADALQEAIRDTASFLRNLPAGRLGVVYQTVGRRRVPIAVTAVVADTYVKSMGLLLISLVFAAALGIGLGSLAAYWEGSPLSLALLTSSLLGVSVPTFFGALLLQVIEIRWYQRTGMRLVPVGGFGWDAHLVLPALVLAARPLAQIARITFASLSEAAHQDYARTARAKGLHPRQVWSRHVVPNAAVPILTALGVSLRFSLGSLPVVEYYFGWPGLGASLLSAVRAQQFNLVAALALALGLTFMVINLALELGYRAVDPRLREQGET